MPTPIEQARDLLDARYARLSADPDAQGWYPRDAHAETLTAWDRLLGLHLNTPGHVAELGSGAGDLALHLAARGWTAIGFELSPNAVTWARRKAVERKLTAEFHALDLAVPLPDDLLIRYRSAFDLVLDADCLHYILGPERRRTFLTNARALLAPDGLFVLRTIVDAPPPEQWATLGYDPATRTCRHGDVPMTYCAAPEEVAAELENAGFRIESHALSAATPERSAFLTVLARPVP